ncbi:hypothetical protein [Desulforamulus hydrothermalis]|uniref:Uncharacterized protein n=1 Tax=Desulforamulus hydrothermalis Lam5 = DSM 18033 TaxID=1121428 RepID=K8E081_9FIRM|nr:hypothetical protein [Desulforamulus hydrothermalis]CCO08887.1 conserved hypothetical protein [Desulforamulus hydrothermalis Lam5 = DSM 18033]SHG74008.1 hypothetical protein SAMN02745177_00203 [Desulforamulus hydrothermalis Lam5 = DSM 18033]
MADNRIKIDKEKIKQFWARLNEIKVEDIVPYVKQNKRQALLAGGALLVLIGLILLVKWNVAFFSSQAGGTAPAGAGLNQAAPAVSQPTTTLLPATKRTMEERPQPRDPFSGSLQLKGVITGGGGDNLAIIEAGNTSYIVGPGQELAGGLVVKEVTGNWVVLQAASGKIYLEFNGRVKKEASPAAAKQDKQAAGAAADQAAGSQNKGGGN